MFLSFYPCLLRQSLDCRHLTISAIDILFTQWQLQASHLAERENLNDILRVAACAHYLIYCTCVSESTSAYVSVLDPPPHFSCISCNNSKIYSYVYILQLVLSLRLMLLSWLSDSRVGNKLITPSPPPPPPSAVLLYLPRYWLLVWHWQASFYRSHSLRRSVVVLARRILWCLLPRNHPYNVWPSAPLHAIWTDVLCQCNRGIRLFRESWYVREKGTIF